MATRFAVHLTRSFKGDLERLPAAAQQTVLEVIKRLETNPFGPAPKIKLKGKGIGQWRLEVWPYRVRYDIERPRRYPLPRPASKRNLPGLGILQDARRAS